MNRVLTTAYSYVKSEEGAGRDHYSSRLGARVCRDGDGHDV